MPLTWLELDNTPVSDLTPLRGLKLTYLGLFKTPGARPVALARHAIDSRGFTSL